MQPVGISILTNSNRRNRLERCINSLLTNCAYRPLIIGVFDNGSTDDTPKFMEDMCNENIYGVTFRYTRGNTDEGCAFGTNKSIEMVSDCEFQVHLESDFEMLTPEESGEDRMFLHKVVEFLKSDDCDYVYLRRMRDENESRMHWWSQWMSDIDEERDNFMHREGFWWSNNPTAFRLNALKEANILPLDENKDGPKGSSFWSAPELDAGTPPNAWIHKWGVFVHERGKDETFAGKGCSLFGPYGKSGCKYGFWKSEPNFFCKACDRTRDFRDMAETDERDISGTPAVRNSSLVVFHTNQLSHRGTEMGIWTHAHYNEKVLGNKSVILSPPNAEDEAYKMFNERFKVKFYESWDEAEEWLKDNNADVLYMRKSGEDDGLISENCRTVINCAFPNRDEHGDVYAYISEWLSKYSSNGELPWIPPVIEKFPDFGDLRNSLGIPEDAVVFGRHGGPEFDLPAVRQAVEDVASECDDVWFLFLGLPKFTNVKNTIFMEPTCDFRLKSAFIKTCDAMLHARHRGETFGLAPAEFSAMGRPVLTWNGSKERAHIEMLGDSAFTYENYEDLKNMLKNWYHHPGDEWDVYTDRFSPVEVMKRFKEVCGL